MFEEVLKRALRVVFGGGSDISAANPLQVYDPKVGSLISYDGTTTADGAGDGSTLIDSVLTTKPDYNGNLVIITSGAYAGQARDINGVTTGGTVTPHLAFGGQIVSGVTFVIVGIRTTPAEVAALAAALGNPTADMSAVTQSEAASLAAYEKNFRSHSRAHNQTRICLVVPDLADLAADLQNTAIKAELDKIGTVSVLDQTGVDGGQEDWDVYNLVVVGSNAHDDFGMVNIDDLISFHGPLMVCNADVAEHLLMGTEAAQSDEDDDEYCETIANRVMQLVFGSTGEKVLFDSAQRSDRLDMSAAALTAQVLMVDATGEGPGLTVVGWLPAESVDAESYELNDGSALPSGRLFAGCFVHADRLTDLGTLLLRRLARNLAQAHLHPLSVNVKRAYQENIPDADFALAAIDNALDANPPGADDENSIVDIDQKNGRTYVLRSLWVNVTSFGTAGTKLTFGLWVLLNEVVTQVDSVDVAVLGIQNLADIFGLQEVHANGIWVTVLTDSASGDAACSGTFNYAEAKK
ncbi:hypothetical protein ES708_19528 [subsurface metagenome]